MSDPKQQGRSQNVFYDFEVTQCHLVNVKGNEEPTIFGGNLEDGDHGELQTDNYKTLMRKFKEDLSNALVYVYGLEDSLL